MTDVELARKHHLRENPKKRPKVNSKINPLNYSRIGKSDTYIVRTQAGFKKIVRLYKRAWDITDSYGYPKSYPSLVTVSTGYAGYHYLSFECTHVNKILKAIQDSDRACLEQTNE